MDYNPINLFLKKFEKILKTNSSQKDEIIEIILKEVKYEIKIENIKIKNTTIFFSNINPILKNEIFIHKEKILNQLKEKGLTINEIR